MLLGTARSVIMAMATHLHSKCLHASANFTANATKANDPQGFPLQLHPHEEASLPLALFHGGMALGEVAGHGQEEGAGLLCGADGVSARSTANQARAQVVPIKIPHMLLHVLYN